MNKKLVQIVLFLFVAAALSPLTFSAASQQYPTGPWWFGEYFEGHTPLNEPVLARYDLNINFEWGAAPPDPALPADDFAVRWTRTQDFVEGSYTFWAVHDDGLRLWVDDQLVLDRWYDQAAYLEWSAPELVDGITTTVSHREPIVHYAEMYLSAGAHRLRVEYYEHGKHAIAKLGWTGQNNVDVAPSAPAVSEDACNTIHVVQAGDWLYKISRMYGVSVNRIMQANNLISSHLTPGQTLLIPDADCVSAPQEPSPDRSDCTAIYVVQPGDTLYQIVVKFDVSFAALIERNNIIYPNYTIYPGQKLCIP